MRRATIGGRGAPNTFGGIILATVEEFYTFCDLPKPKLEKREVELDERCHGLLLWVYTEK